MFLALFVACAALVATIDSPRPPSEGQPAGEPTGEGALGGAAFASPTGSPMWRVDCAGGADFTTIGEAIEAADDGDWISVEPCTYAESIDFGGKTLWIASTAGSGSTILDAGGHRAITADKGTGDGTAVVGFTIRDAHDTSIAAVYTDLSALRLEDITFEDSSGAYAVIYSGSSDLELQDVTLGDSNDVGYYGMIFSSRGALIADALTVDCKGRGTAVYTGHGSYFIDHSTLTCGGGTSIQNEHSTGRVHRSVFTNAVTVVSEDDHYTDAVLFENVYFSGTISVTYGAIVLQNSLLDGATLNLNQVYGTYIRSSVIQHSRCPITSTFTPVIDTAEPAPDPIEEVVYSDFYDLNSEHCDGITTYSGENGNIAVDPKFTDEAGGDFTLKSSSPLIDAGQPDAVYNDPDGSLNDIGLYGGPRSMGGGW
jgi:hypothetical protein